MHKRLQLVTFTLGSLVAIAPISYLAGQKEGMIFACFTFLMIGLIVGNWYGKAEIRSYKAKQKADESIALNAMKRVVQSKSERTF